MGIFIKMRNGKLKEHAVRVRTTNISINDICEDREFPETKTRKLTSKEFHKLKKFNFFSFFCISGITSHLIML